RLQLLDAFFGLMHALLALEDKRLGDNTDRERADVARHSRQHRRTTGARATTHARCDKDHVRALEVFSNLLLIFQGGAAADFRIGAGTQAFGHHAPSWMRTGAWLACKDCASVFATMKSTPESLEPIIVLTALPPPPPMPITLMRAAARLFCSTISNIDFPPH